MNSTDYSYDNSPTQTQNGLPNEYLFKILVIGDIGTGKTSFIKRYVHNFFSQSYKSTIGVDFAMKILNWDAKTILRLQLWDIAGQERFGNMTRVYYKEAAGAVVVFDMTRTQTFEAALRWKSDLDQKLTLLDGRPIPAVLLANKCDTSASWPDEELNRVCEQNGFLGWYKTSAKENIGIDDAASFLASNILYVKQAGHYEIPVFSRDGGNNIIGLGSPRPDSTAPKRKCCD